MSLHIGIEYKDNIIVRKTPCDIEALWYVAKNIQDNMDNLQVIDSYAQVYMCSKKYKCSYPQEIGVEAAKLADTLYVKSLD